MYMLQWLQIEKFVPSNFASSLKLNKTKIDKKMEEDFRDEMKKAGVKIKVMTYKNTFHSFTYPEATEIGKKHNFFISYNPVSANKAWEQMKVFLKTQLK